MRFSTPTGDAGAFLVQPGKKGARDARAGVVVLQEWWGLVPHIEDVAARFAAEGYVALAPDLYHGKTTVEAEEASHLLSELDWDRAVSEIGAGVRHMREKERCARVGVVGFCMGGALAMLAAAHAGVDAYAAFYGFPPKEGVLGERVDAPGLILFGEDEAFFSTEAAEAFADAQRARGRECEVVVYPDAGHAFFNDTRPEVFAAPAAEDAWRRTLALFQRSLRA